MPKTNYEPLLSSDGKLLKDHWPLDEVFVKRLNKWFKRKPWFLKRKYLAWAIAKGLVVPPRLPARKHRAGRRRGHNYRVNSFHTRYRERNPNLEPHFMGNKDLGDLAKNVPIGVIKTYSNGSVSNVEKMWRSGTPAGSLSSERTWDQVNPGPPYRSGGPFASIKMKIPASQVWNVGVVSNVGKVGVDPKNREEYHGSFFDGGNWGSDSVSNYLSSTVPTLLGYDTLAWEKTKPRVTKSSLSQFIYELKDLPRMLETTANLLHNSWRSFGGGYSSVVMHPVSVADNFINHEFGWAPFLNDMAGFYQLYVNLSRYIAQTVRDNGEWLRRRAVLETTETNQLLLRIYSPNLNPWGFRFDSMCRDTTVDGITCKGFSDLRERLVNRVWAEGSFKYYRPEFDDNLMHFGDQLTNIHRIATLYGLRINPTVVWKLTPWSWAVDWFTSVGKFIEHHDDFITDGIVSRYLYVMRSKERFVTKTTVANFYSGARSMSWQRSFSQKQRKVADSPYGFDLPWNNLSPRQLGILGSIGVTRSATGFLSRGA